MATVHRSSYYDRNKRKYALIVPIVIDCFSLISLVNDNSEHRRVFQSLISLSIQVRHNSNGTWRIRKLFFSPTSYNRQRQFLQIIEFDLSSKVLIDRFINTTGYEFRNRYAHYRSLHRPSRITDFRKFHCSYLHRYDKLIKGKYVVWNLGIH